MSLDEAMDDARPEAKALPIVEATLNASVSSNTDLSSVANGRAGAGASETGTQPPKQVESSVCKELNGVKLPSAEDVHTIMVHLHVSAKTAQQRVALQKAMIEVVKVLGTEGLLTL